MAHTVIEYSSPFHVPLDTTPGEQADLFAGAIKECVKQALDAAWKHGMPIPGTLEISSEIGEKSLRGDTDYLLKAEVNVSLS